MMRLEKTDVSGLRPTSGTQEGLGEMVQPAARLIAVLLWVVVICILLRIVQFGLTPIRLLQLLISVGIVLACVKRGTGLRAGWHTVCIAGFLLLSLTGTIQFGLAAPGVLALVATNILTAIFARKRVAQILLLVQFFFFALIAAAFRFGLIAPRVDLNLLNADPVNWILLAVCLAALSVFCIHLVERTRLHRLAVNAELAQQNETLETLVQHAPEGIVVQDMETGHFTVVNPAAERLLAASAEALIGRAGLREFASTRSAEGHMSKEVLAAYLSEALEGEVPRFEWRLRDIEGREFPCEMTLTRLPNPDRRLVRVSIADISDRAEAGRMRNLNTAVLRNSSEGMIRCDRAGAIQWINPAFEKDTGFLLHQVSGECLGTLLVGGGRKAVMEIVEGNAAIAPAAGPLWSGEMKFRHRDGEPISTWTTVNALHDATEQLTGFVLLIRNRSELLRANTKLSQQAETDQLTGLVNRIGLIRHIDAALAQHKGAPIALVSLDIDQLKQANDRFGHDIGDEILLQLTGRLQGCVEAADCLARHSGDEFSVMLQGADAVERAQDLAPRLRAEISRPIEFAGGKMQLSASIGVTFSPDHAADAAGLIRAADQALYVAKSGGGNRVVNYTPEIGRRAHDRVRLVDEIEQGLDRGEFRLLYQPVVALEDGRLAKVEALVRWQHPELGLLGPDRFIPHAEEARVIDRIGDWVFHKCISDLPAMQARFGSDFQASLNVSPLQLASGDASRFEAWEESLRVLGQGGGLIFEITEGAMLDPNPATITRLQAFRAAGVQIALDDFGAGHTSLRYYLNHDFDFLKIDREFVTGGPESARARALCESLLGFARRLDAVAIAEGVETPQQVDMLRQAGCQLGQGYFFSPPLPLEKLLELPSTLPLD